MSFNHRHYHCSDHPDHHLHHQRRPHFDDHQNSDRAQGGRLAARATQAATQLRKEFKSPIITGFIHINRLYEQAILSS